MTMTHNYLNRSDPVSRYWRVGCVTLTSGASLSLMPRSIRRLRGAQCQTSIASVDGGVYTHPRCVHGGWDGRQTHTHTDNDT